MKKAWRLILVALFLISSSVWSTHAQEPAPTETETPREFNYGQALQDYVYNFNLYRQAHKDYLIARSQYKTYQTLTAETVALEQTIKMLQARDETIATFLTALRLRLAEKTNVGSSRLNVLYLRLDEEVSWYRDHAKSLTSAGSIPDLLKLSQQTEEHYSNTEAMIYESLLEIYFYQESLLHTRLQSVIDELEMMIGQIREAGDKDTGRTERWLLESKNRKTRSEEKLTEARGMDFFQKEKSASKRQQYNRIIYLLEQSHQYLKETNANLLEIVMEVKRGD